MKTVYRVYQDTDEISIADLHEQHINYRGSHPSMLTKSEINKCLSLDGVLIGEYDKITDAYDACDRVDVWTREQRQHTWFLQARCAYVARVELDEDDDQADWELITVKCEGWNDGMLPDAEDVYDQLLGSIQLCNVDEWVDDNYPNADEQDAFDFLAEIQRIREERGDWWYAVVSDDYEQWDRGSMAYGKAVKMLKEAVEDGEENAVLVEIDNTTVNAYARNERTIDEV